MKNLNYTGKAKLKPVLILTKLFTVILIIFSCSSNDDGSAAARANSLQVFSGDNQSSYIGNQLSDVIEILVNDQNGNAFAGTTVSFSVSEGTVIPNIATTDATGKALVTWTLGSSIGEQILTATAFANDGTPLIGSPLNILAEGLDLCQILTNTEQLPIGPDAGTETNSIINVSDDFIIAPDVLVSINLEHTFDADLEIFLIAPNGLIIELSTDNGAGGDNYTNTVFDDQASALIIDGIAPFTGSFRPEGVLSGLIGNEAQGDWILKIIDDAGADGGMLLSWSLQLCRS
ncbi:proprotein convertase P-domain-containing protein [Winogradskyella forsetii]|uniref:proprotein convertase P-domain-containing protein n=1 Tax=Winogradskyella forsetii TaxID=2686077 RepID=UPI0015C0C7A8|nr:proprotein convertase P-domain-containing protein [Winogradskyella forsetii]